MKCKNCGFEVPNSSKTCPQCGTKLSGDKFPTWVIVLLVIFGVGIFTLPIIGIVAAMTIPTLVADTDSAKNRSQFKKTLATLNQALLMSEAMNDKTYSRADDVVNIAIKETLSGAKNIPNGVIFADGSAIKYEKTGNPCQKTAPSSPSAHNACAIITIDTNGFNTPPNKKTEKTSSRINDQFRVLLYSTVVIPEPGTVEDNIINEARSRY